MSFVRLEHVHAQVWESRVSVAIDARRSRDGVRDVLCGRANIGSGVLKAAGIERDERVEVLWGNGPDAGKVQIKKSAQGRLKISRSNKNIQSSRSGVISFANLPRVAIKGLRETSWLLKLERWGATPAPWEAGPGSIILTLPPRWWLVSSPTDHAQDTAILDRPTARQLEAMRNEPLKQPVRIMA